MSMTQIPPDDVLESTKFRIRESDQLKTVLELYDMEIHQKISVRNYRKLNTMVDACIRNFDYKISTPEVRGLKQVPMLRVAGI